MAKRRQPADRPEIPTHRANDRSKPLKIRIEIVAVGGEEGEALFRMQRAAIVRGALKWASTTNTVSDQSALDHADVSDQLASRTTTSSSQA